jgi:uncharacterized membrane protein
LDLMAQRHNAQRRRLVRSARLWSGALRVRDGCSILVHGVTATPLMTRIDARRRREVLRQDQTQP